MPVFAKRAPEWRRAKFFSVCIAARVILAVVTAALVWFAPYGEIVVAAVAGLAAVLLLCQSRIPTPAVWWSRPFHAVNAGIVCLLSAACALGALEVPWTGGAVLCVLIYDVAVGVDYARHYADWK